VWEQARLVVEIDGRWHMDARAWWADMQRDNDLTIDGYRVLRFPAFMVRDHPEMVAMQIAKALDQAGSTEPGRPGGVREAG
jgi:very-short-patch-repair endonuclease